MVKPEATTERRSKGSAAAPAASAASTDGGGELSSLEKGLLLLRVLSSAAGGMTPAELAAATQLNRSTIYRLSAILERDGWVQRIGGSGRNVTFTIGAATLGMSILAGNTHDTTARIQPAFDRLAASTGETVHVGALEHTQIVHIARASPPAAGMRVTAELGTRDHAHATALGKALLSALTPDEVERAYGQATLAPHTPATITTIERLQKELERIRANGFAVDDEESRPGLKCVAAPVYGPAGSALFAISVTTTPSRLAGAQLDEVAEAVRECARFVTTSFGGSVPMPD
jgi:IclR family acetate operon transcriptional repressor